MDIVVLKMIGRLVSVEALPPCRRHCLREKVRTTSVPIKSLEKQRSTDI